MLLHPQVLTAPLPNRWFFYLCPTYKVKMKFRAVGHLYNLRLHEGGKVVLEGFKILVFCPYLLKFDG